MATVSTVIDASRFRDHAWSDDTVAMMAAALPR
jgi:hypothetical protein